MLRNWSFYRLSTFLKLFGAMGLTWLFEVIAVVIMKTSEEPIHAALTVILNLPNVLQGLIIFCVFGIKKSVKSGIRKTYRWMKLLFTLTLETKLSLSVRNSMSKTQNSFVAHSRNSSSSGRGVSMNPNPTKRSIVKNNVSIASEASGDETRARLFEDNNEK